MITDSTNVSHPPTPRLAPRRYLALLQQTGSNAPVATVLENTLGEVTWSYVSNGTYRATSAGLFVAGKTTILAPCVIVNGGDYASADANTVQIDGISDGTLDGGAQCFVEIVVYP